MGDTPFCYWFICVCSAFCYCFEWNQNINQHQRKVWVYTESFFLLFAILFIKFIIFLNGKKRCCLSGGNVWESFDIGFSTFIQQKNSQGSTLVVICNKNYYDGNYLSHNRNEENYCIHIYLVFIQCVITCSTTNIITTIKYQISYSIVPTNTKKKEGILLSARVLSHTTLRLINCWMNTIHIKCNKRVRRLHYIWLEQLKCIQVGP